MISAESARRADAWLETRPSGLPVSQPDPAFTSDEFFGNNRMILSSIVDVSVVCLLSTRGILMAPLPDSVVGLVILPSVLYLIALDFLKLPILRRLMYTS